MNVKMARGIVGEILLVKSRTHKSAKTQICEKSVLNNTIGFQITK